MPRHTVKKIITPLRALFFLETPTFPRIFWFTDDPNMVYTCRRREICVEIHFMHLKTAFAALSGHRGVCGSAEILQQTHKHIRGLFLQ